MQPLLPLQLGHLTALKVIICLGGFEILCEEDVLPPRLQRLDARGCPFVAPLLQLQQLKHLTIKQFITPFEQLTQLRSGLSSLSLTQLQHWTTDSINSAAPGWQGLPITSMALGVFHQYNGISMPVQQHLARPSPTLTALSFDNGII
eukprot:gene4158-4406_t